MRGGTLFGSTVFFPRVQSLPGSTYVRYWQAQNLDFGVRMPILLLTCLALLFVASALSLRRGWRIQTLTVLAAALVVLTVALTLIQMEPLNRVADSWNPDALPADWAATRDLWASWHLARTMLAVLAFGCLLASQTLLPHDASGSAARAAGRVTIG